MKGEGFDGSLFRFSWCVGVNRGGWRIRRGLFRAFLVVGPKWFEVMVKMM